MPVTIEKSTEFFDGCPIMRPHVQIVVQHDSALQERGALLGQIGQPC